MLTPTPQCRLLRLTAILLMVSAFYQVGASPCGCLEHNDWLHLLGYVTHVDEVVVHEQAHESTWQDASCHGDESQPYVDTARSARREVSQLPSYPLSTASGPQTIAFIAAAFLDHPPPDPPRPKSLRTRLQVFLL